MIKYSPLILLVTLLSACTPATAPDEETLRKQEKLKQESQQQFEAPQLSKDLEIINRQIQSP